MIGIKQLCLETKKPVYETGVFWAVAQLMSNLFDNHSVHHTGGMCKDSLLVFQQSFFMLPATWFAWLSYASFRKESFAMDEAEFQRWKTEIAILAERILAWLQANNNDPRQPIVDAIKRVALEDCMILGVEEALWTDMEAYHYLDDNLAHSDVWQCAVADALQAFKAQFVLAEVAS